MALSAGDTEGVGSSDEGSQGPALGQPRATVGADGDCLPRLSPVGSVLLSAYKPLKAAP